MIAIKETSAAGGWCLFGFVVVWNLFTLPIGLFLVRWGWPMDQRSMFLALFPIAGALLLLFFAFHALRRLRFGTSVCRIERAPIPLGATFRGEVDVRLHELPPSGFALRLACVRRTVSGAGKNRSVHERVLWQDEQTVMHGAMPAPIGMRVPFRFDIPFDCEPTDESNPSDTVIWKLNASAEVPGIDYDASFDLPVFRTEGSRDELTPRVHSAASWQPSREITLSPDAIVIRPGRGAGDWIGFLVFFPIWFGALELARRFGTPIFVIAFFMLIGAVVALAILDFLAGRTTLRPTRDSLSVRRTWFGLGRTITIPTSTITRFETKVGSTFGNRGFHDVRAVLQNGRTRSVARHLRNRNDAEMLAERLTQSLR